MFVIICAQRITHTHTHTHTHSVALQVGLQHLAGGWDNDKVLAELNEACVRRERERKSCLLGQTLVKSSK